MPQETKLKLIQIQSTLSNDHIDIETLSKKYKEISQLGFKYATLQNSLLNEYLIHGRSKVKFRKSSHLLGYIGNEFLNLSDTSFQELLHKLCVHYLKIIIANDGLQDITYQDALAMNAEVLSQFDLKIDNWMIYIPFNFMKKTPDNKYLESKWQSFLNTSSSLNDPKKTSLDFHEIKNFVQIHQKNDHEQISISSDYWISNLPKEHFPIYIKIYIALTIAAILAKLFIGIKTSNYFHFL